MKAYVVDTHALLWYLSKPARLGRRARRALSEVDKGTARAWVPSIVLVEVVLLGEAGRTRVGVAEIEATLGRNPEIKLLPLDIAQTSEFDRIRSVRDPFDRLIIAAARTMACPLITADGPISESGLVDIVWD